MFTFAEKFQSFVLIVLALAAMFGFALYQFAPVQFSQMLHSFGL